MAAQHGHTLSAIIGGKRDDILSDWLRLQTEAGVTRDGRIKEAELRTQSRDFIAAFDEALASGSDDVRSAPFARVRERLEDLSRSRATQGFSPRETANFVFSMKRPLFEQIRAQHGNDAEALAGATWALTRLVDELGLYTMEVYQKSREEVIARQGQEIAELSTPVVTLWDGVLALPLIGTLDSARTQVVMENLLQAIVDQQATIAIIDITGVPTVDTLVAQHLIKTVAAARLMGADCVISGIRPQIAQTMVHLGVELNVTTKATLAGAFKVALQRTGQTVVKVKPEGARA